MTCDPWPIQWPCDEPIAEAEQRAIAQDAAQAMLWARTGRRLGICAVTETYRPAAGVCGLPRPYKDSSGFWHNAVRCRCAIPLNQRPVFAVDSVVVNGTPFDDWVLEGGHLRHADGCWPSVDECAGGGVVVTYRWGVPLRPALYDTADPPNLIRAADPLYGLASAAMGEVTREVLEGMCGKPCKLPSRALVVTRQGVTVQMGSTTELADRGFLGLPIADELIRTANPNRLKSRSRVYSPDQVRSF